jgi:hypothetical protein
MISIEIQYPMWNDVFYMGSAAWTMATWARRHFANVNTCVLRSQTRIVCIQQLNWFLIARVSHEQHISHYNCCLIVRAVVCAVTASALQTAPREQMMLAVHHMRLCLHQARNALWAPVEHDWYVRQYVIGLVLEPWRHSMYTSEVRKIHLYIETPS